MKGLEGIDLIFKKEKTNILRFKIYLLNSYK